MRLSRWLACLPAALLLSAPPGCGEAPAKPTPKPLEVGAGPDAPAFVEAPGVIEDSSEPSDGPAVVPGKTLRGGMRGASPDPEPAGERPPVDAQALAASIAKGLVWLREAQHDSGGWGAGSHSKQQNRDPHAVKLDPATTAFVMLTLLRADGGRLDGAHGAALRKGVDWLVAAIEAGPKEGAQITTLRGTQPQTKLGASVDTAMAAQCLARVVPLLGAKEAIAPRAKAALAVCVKKLENSQQASGTWSGGGGWAPVLQASLANQALELSRRAGMQVDGEVLRKARNFQQSNVDAAGKTVALGGGAGVELYSFAGSGRAMAPRAARARALDKLARDRGVITDADAPLTPGAVMEVAGVTKTEADEIVQAGQKLAAQSGRLKEAALLRGFGNNGGEEFLSYLLTSEALVIAGGEEWTSWNERMGSRLTSIQTKDGSWTGHHCITSPVFCTAAVLQTLTVTRDVAYLKTIADEEIGKDAEAKAGKAKAK